VNQTILTAFTGSGYRQSTHVYRNVRHSMRRSSRVYPFALSRGIICSMRM
jgi:hypothetical protein